MKVKLEHTTPDYLALELEDEDVVRLVRGLPAIGEKRAPCTGESVSIIKLTRDIEKPIAQISGKHLDIMLPSSYDERQIAKLHDKTIEVRTSTGAKTQRYITCYII